MISESEHKVIHKFLKNVGAEHLEVYQELYDHVATSFEKRSITSLDIKTHIREVVQPELGGTKGITRLIKTKTKTFHKEVGNEMLTFFQGAKLLCLVAIISASAVALTQPALTKEWFWILTVWSPALLLFYFIIVPIYARKYRVLYLSYYMSRVNALYTPTFLIISLLGYLDAWFLQNTSIALVVFSIFYLFVISALSVLHKTLKKVKSNVAYS